MKGCLLVLSVWKKTPDWYNSLCTNTQPAVSSNSGLRWQAWLISYTLFMLSFVPVFPYVQKRSTSGWRFQRVQAAAWFEDSSIKRGCEGKLVEGQWSREKNPKMGPNLLVMCRTVTLHLTVLVEDSPWPGAGGWAFSEHQGWQRGSKMWCHRALQG